MKETELPWRLYWTCTVDVPDNCRAGISRLFHMRVALRVGEMLQAVKRGRLPGVIRCDQVKTKGCAAWGGGRPVRRMFELRSVGEYARLARQAAITLVEDSKGPSDGKLQ